jgi:hypothetical protein
MITRATWFVAGAAAGAIGASYTRRKVKAVAGQMAPVNVAKGVAGRARSRGQDLVEAVKEGRLVMRAKEGQLRAGRDAEALAIAPAAQIIVLSDVRQLEQLTRAATREAAPARESRRSTDHPSGRRRRSRR